MVKSYSDGYCVYENNAADVPFTKDFYPETFGSTNEVVIKIDWVCNERYELICTHSNFIRLIKVSLKLFDCLGTKLG